MSRPSRSSPPSTARLFQEGQAAPPAGVHIANIDGASRGNPGPAAYAVILRDPRGAKIAEIGKRIGRETNNVAEYYALLAALDYAAANAIRALRVRSDSELLVRQMQGRYKVKSPELQPLYERAQKVVRGLDYFVIEHVPREQNSDADALANLALDGGITDRNRVRSGASSEESPAKSATPLRTIAEYRGGNFVPARELELPEGSKVELEIRVLRNSS